MSSTPPPSLPPVARVRACPQVWDVVRSRCVRVMAGHRMRCGTLSWAAHLLSTGSRDRSVLHRDVRSPADFVARLSGHKSEVCGLKWSPDERELASGGGTADRCIRFWNTTTASSLSCMDTGSQVGA